MKLLQSLRIGTRLTSAFALIIVIALALGLFMVARMGGLADSLTQAGQVQLPKVKQLAKMTEMTNTLRVQLRNLLIYEDQKEVSRSVKLISETRQSFTKLLDELEGKLSTAEDRARLREIREARTAYGRDVDHFLELHDSGRNAEAKVHLAGPVRESQANYFGKLDALSELQFRYVDEEIAAGQASYALSRKLSLGLLLAMLALAGVLAAAIARSIARPLGQAVRLAEAVAAGDLSAYIDAAGRDEIASLNRALQRMVEQLSTIVGNVRKGTDEIGTASTQIATGNQDLSSRTEEQASNLQQTAASMEELTASVQSNANTSKQANQLATGAREAALRGGQAVGQMVQTMEQIEQSSKRIADIINVIDGIAFQTNILALNAAVEAARAGEQGRGFAVVAAEVRTLASRSAQAAREIKALINDSVDRVNAGSAQVHEAGQTMEEIVKQVQRVADLIGEINSSTLEQASGISQVSGAVTQLDQVTQQNAALVEQSAAAAESLRHQAQSLAQAVAVFRLADDGAQRAIAQAAMSSRSASVPGAKAPHPVPAAESLRRDEAAPLSPAAA